MMRMVTDGPSAASGHRGDFIPNFPAVTMKRFNDRGGSPMFLGVLVFASFAPVYECHAQARLDNTPQLSGSASIPSSGSVGPSSSSMQIAAQELASLVQLHDDRLAQSGSPEALNLVNAKGSVASTLASDPVAAAPKRGSAPIDASGSTISSPTRVSNLLGPPDQTVPSQLGVSGEDEAMDEFDTAFGRRQAYTDLRSLRDRLEDMRRPVVNADFARSTQSDNLNITQLEASGDLFFSVGRDRARFGYQNIDYSPRSGGGVEQNSLGGNGTYRINDWSAVTGDFWVNAIKAHNGPTEVVPTYDIFVTLWPNDLVRIDLDAKREIFDNVTSLVEGITADAFGASIDYSPSDDLRMSLRTDYSSYSDNNEREEAEFEAVFRVLSAPAVQLGFRAAGFEFSKLLNDGYYNPKSYESAEGMIRVQASITNKLNVELAASGGAEHADPGGIKPLVRASLQASYKLTKDWTLDGGLSYFSSRDTNSSGFARSTAKLGLHRKF